jgi:hypothetical protein
MTVYVYECEQGHSFEFDVHGLTVCDCGAKVHRDYRSEAVGINVVDLKRTREHPIEEYAAKFLPTNDDFAGPKDPEGRKGMAKWREEHTPADSNKRPYWPGEV